MRKVVVKIEAEVIIEMLEDEKMDETMDKLYIDCLADDFEVQVMNYEITNYEVLDSKLK